MPFTCLDVVKAAGLREGRRAGHERSFACTRHDDEDPSLMVNGAKDTWLCGPCGAGGTAYQLAAFLANCDPADKVYVVKPIRTTATVSQETLPAVVPRDVASSDSLSVVRLKFAA